MNCQGISFGRVVEIRAYDTLYWIALILVVIGGLNWGLIGLLNYNLVAAIFGVNTMLSNLVYILVGLAALYLIIAAAMQPRPATRAV
jgi:uncharacterized protein